MGVGLTITSLGGSCRLGDKPNICAFPSICGDKGDDAEIEREGPKPIPTSNRVASDTSISPGCARAYDSDKDGEGGAVCKDVYLADGVDVLVVVVVIVDEEMTVSSVECEHAAFVKAGGCKNLERSIPGDSSAVTRVVVVVIDDEPDHCTPILTQPFDGSLALLGSIS